MDATHALPVRSWRIAAPKQNMMHAERNWFMMVVYVMTVVSRDDLILLYWQGIVKPTLELLLYLFLVDLQRGSTV